jgi:hypothetical protein
LTFQTSVRRTLDNNNNNHNNNSGGAKQTGEKFNSSSVKAARLTDGQKAPPALGSAASLDEDLRARELIEGCGDF